MDKLFFDKLVLVEGKYDKIRLENVIDANIVEVNGFGIFKDKKLQSTVKKLAENGAIIITDSDISGYKIRVFLASLLEGREVVNVFMPRISGVEPRKRKPSAAGYLGVEGIPDGLIIERLSQYACAPVKPRGNVAAADLFELGLSGRDGSKRRRCALLENMGVQTEISTNLFLRLINEKYTRAELEEILNTIEKEQ